MIHNESFRRKVIYLGLIAILLIPLYVVGHPAVGDPNSGEASPGGRLAQLRAKNDLSPAELGEIDPTSESMKLATLGMRGIAANILWTKANDYKKKENWEGLVAVVNQMARLQPNFISVWEFQSHNLSYNISVEQDDYRFRYLWVKKGIEFLMQGIKYNRREPKLFWTLGWYTGQKFGRADENKQFRRLYRTDHDFHELQQSNVDIDRDARGADGKPDTWLTSRLWFNKSYDIVDTQGKPIRGKSPHIYYADGPKARMNYAVTIEEEGILDEKAETAWRLSGQEWDKLGDRQVPSSWGPVFHLNDEERLLEESKRLSAELDKLAPGKREEIRLEKVAKLPPKQRAALEITDPKNTDPAQFQDRFEAVTNTAVSHREVAERAPSNVRAKAMRLSQDASNAETVAGYVDRYRENVNFEYWRARCRVEQLPNTVRARKHIYDAEKLLEKAEVDKARQEFELAWDLWAEITIEHPELVDSLTADDLFDHVKKYLELMAQIDVKIPADFKLKSLVEKYNHELSESLKQRLADPSTVKPTPESNAPATPAPATPAPATPAPATPAPATPAPATPAPATPAPATPAPATPAPATPAPATPAPATPAPATTPKTDS